MTTCHSFRGCGPRVIIFGAVMRLMMFWKQQFRGLVVFDSACVVIDFVLVADSASVVVFFFFPAFHFSWSENIQITLTTALSVFFLQPQWRAAAKIFVVFVVIKTYVFIESPSDFHFWSCQRLPTNANKRTDATKVATRQRSTWLSMFFAVTLLLHSTMYRGTR